MTRGWRNGTSGCPSSASTLPFFPSISSASRECPGGSSTTRRLMLSGTWYRRLARLLAARAPSYLSTSFMRRSRRSAPQAITHGGPGRRRSNGSCLLRRRSIRGRPPPQIFGDEHDHAPAIVGARERGVTASGDHDGRTVSVGGRAGRNNRLIGVGGLTLAVTMIGLTYAAAPFYSAFCRATGYEGTPQHVNANSDAEGRGSPGWATRTGCPPRAWR